MYNKLTEGQKAQWLKAIYSMSVSSEITFFWKCNSLDPKQKEKQWSKTDLSTDELPHQPKKDPNSLIVSLHKPDSVNNDLSVTDFALKKRKWEDLVRLIAADACKKKTLTSYCYKQWNQTNYWLQEIFYVLLIKMCIIIWQWMIRDSQKDVKVRVY